VATTSTADLAENAATSLDALAGSLRELPSRPSRVDLRCLVERQFDATANLRMLTHVPEAVGAVEQLVGLRRGMTPRDLPQPVTLDVWAAAWRAWAGRGPP
jgi:hypothetical protein